MRNSRCHPGAIELHRIRGAAVHTSEGGGSVSAAAALPDTYGASLLFATCIPLRPDVTTCWCEKSASAGEHSQSLVQLGKV